MRIWCACACAPRANCWRRDTANREAFRAQDAGNLDFVGLALHGAKKAVDKAVKGLSLHR
jgi:hypothetical protein